MDSFWQSREERGDPIGGLGVEYGKEASDRSIETQISSAILKGAIFNKNDDSTGNFSNPQSASSEELSMSLEAFQQSQDDWGAVRQGLAEAHIDAVDADKSGTPNFLSAGQITDYHHDVFSDIGLPPTAFGGTPLTGGDWEANVTNAITGWCKACDKE